MNSGAVEGLITRPYQVTVTGDVSGSLTETLRFGEVETPVARSPGPTKDGSGGGRLVMAVNGAPSCHR